MRESQMTSTYFLPKVVGDEKLRTLIKTFLKREWPEKDKIHNISVKGKEGSFFVQNDVFSLEIDAHRIEFTISANSSSNLSELGQKFRDTMDILFKKYS